MRKYRWYLVSRIIRRLIQRFWIFSGQEKRRKRSSGASVYGYPLLRNLRLLLYPSIVVFVLAIPLSRLVLPNQSAVVTNVIDGDTFDVRYKNGSVERIRLYGVDAPEMSQGSAGLSAFSTLKSVLIGNTVTLDCQATKSYNRSVCSVYIGSVDIAAGLARAGLVRCVSSITTKYEKHCAKASESDPAYTVQPAWKYRHSSI